MRLERLRRLWTQCDLFEALAPTDAPVEHPRVTTKKPRAGAAGKSTRTGRARSPRTHRDDVAYVEQLVQAHARYNAELFGGTLRSVEVRISRRMKNRLGHYMAAGNGQGAEIAISRKHISRDPWDDVLHTFVHEMVHQWQDENGHPLDHGQSFRRKARQIGISARATRPVAPSAATAQQRLAARAVNRRRS